MIFDGAKLHVGRELGPVLLVEWLHVDVAERLHLDTAVLLHAHQPVMRRVGAEDSDQARGLDFHRATREDVDDAAGVYAQRV